MALGLVLSVEATLREPSVVCIAGTALGLLFSCSNSRIFLYVTRFSNKFLWKPFELIDQ